MTDPSSLDPRSTDPSTPDPSSTGPGSTGPVGAEPTGSDASSTGMNGTDAGVSGLNEQPATVAGPPAAASASRRAFSTRERTIGAVCLAVGLVTGIVGSVLAVQGVGVVASLQASSAMTDATDTCDVLLDGFIVLGDEGQSLSMQSAGEESAGADVGDMICVLDELDMPDSVLSRISSTRALDGRQSATWSEYSASWGYHPDSGLDMVVNLTDQ